MPAPTTIAATPVVNIVTPDGQTCICVPTGSCTPGGTGNGDGSGLIDIRIVINPVVGYATAKYFVDPFTFELSNIFSLINRQEE